MKINASDFDTQVMGTAMPVLVEFYSDSCGACQAVKPVVQDLAMELLGKVKFCEIDTQTNPALAAKYSITAIPAFKLFKNGKVVAETRGAMNKQQLKTFCTQVR